jgi:hypothetical protein
MIISEHRIVEALYTNICPECGRKIMYYKLQEYCHGNNHFDLKHFICCGFCQNRWEIKSETKQRYVRICDTYSYKKFKGLI